jgi:quercetin dioxygenase-like cupin family protein
MNTIRISAKEMEQRVARFSALKPLPIQSNSTVPLAALDVMYAREIYSVIGLDGDVKTPINSGAPIRGAGGMTMALAVCPPGQGPGLHAHRDTYETFTVLKGRFEVSWNDEGEDTTILEELDTISIPPGVFRAFKNVGTENAMLQAVITGGVHDMNDIEFAAHARRTIESVGSGLSGEFEKVGFRFAGENNK